jgi:PhnB protein
MATAKRPVPEGYYTVTPSLTLDNAPQAIEWYKKALGAEELSRSTGPDGKIMHAELRIGDSRIMLNDAVMGGKGPKAIGGSPSSLWLYVEDCDALFKRAVGAGAAVKMPVENQFWGDRCGMIDDPHGYSWSIATHKEDLTREEIDKRAAEFFKNFAAKTAAHS